MNIMGSNGCEVIKLAEEAVAFFSQLPDMAGEDCGYFTLRDNLTGRVMMLFQVNTCPDDKEGKYCTLSLEKGRRLFNNPKHVSSFQSRNPGALIPYPDLPDHGINWGHWGGAIRCPDSQLILSFSGLPELGDEAVALAIAVQAGWLSGSKARAIAEISENPHFLPLMEEWSSYPRTWYK